MLSPYSACRRAGTQHPQSTAVISMMWSVAREYSSD